VAGSMARALRMRRSWVIGVGGAGLDTASAP
jgi:hypothetical protein